MTSFCQKTLRCLPLGTKMLKSQTSIVRQFFTVGTGKRAHCPPVLRRNELSGKIRCMTAEAVKYEEKSENSVPVVQNDHKHEHKPSWKASIDFKYIRDNKEAVRLNAVNRNSSADIDKVCSLYESFVQRSLVSNFCEHCSLES